MTILKAGVDQGIGTQGMMRPNEAAARRFAHLLLLPGILRGMSHSGGYPSALRHDIGYSEPRAARAVAGEIRSVAHLLAMHCVNCLARPLQETRPFWPTRAFRALQVHADWALGDPSGGSDDES